MSAARGAREVLEALASAVPVPIASIATRACPTLPLTTEERVADNRAQTIADSVTYRESLSTAAEARGWSLHWYDRERAPRDAAAVLGREDIDAFLSAMGRRATLASQAQAYGGRGAFSYSALTRSVAWALAHLTGDAAAKR